jgi:hypothetical protein
MVIENMGILDTIEPVKPSKETITILIGFILIWLIIGFFIGYYFPRLW